MELFLDTETTGLALFKEPYTHESQPDIIQIGLVLSDAEKIYFKAAMLVDPTIINTDWIIKPDTEKIHGISGSMVKKAGIPTPYMLDVFYSLLMSADILVCHNTDFDKKLVQTAAHRSGGKKLLEDLSAKPTYCTMKSGTPMCKLPGPYGWKWPKLKELHKYLFGEEFEGQHDALEDVLATRRCYYKMQEMEK